MRLLVAILLLLIAAPAWAQQGQGMSQAVVVSSCGGGALPAGPLTNLTMNPQGQLCLVGISGGGGGCPQATAYLARTTGGNEGGNATNITTLICGLVTDGVITGNMSTTGCGKFDAFYVLAQQNQTDAQLNLCSTSFNIVNTLRFGAAPLPTAIAFTSYQGFTGQASGATYLNTNFDPSTAPTPHFVLNNASYGLWSYAIPAPGEAGCTMGQNTNNQLFNRFTDGVFYGWVNSAVYAQTPTTITKGLSVLDRPDASNIFQYQNGASAPAFTSAAGALPTGAFRMGGCVGSGQGTAQIMSEGHIGGSLGATLELALYNRLRTYMTAVGVP